MIFSNIILIFFLFSCKNFSSDESNVEENYSQAGQKENIDKYQFQFKKFDSCELDKGKFKLYLLQNEKNTKEIVIRIVNSKNFLIDSTKFILDDVSSINIHYCEENSFFLGYENNIGNNYSSVYHKFDVNKTSNSFFWSKTYNTTSTRQGISMVGNKLDKKVPFGNYTAKETDVKKHNIYSFSGFQEEKEPFINSYLNLIKLNYKEKNKSNINLFGDKFVINFFLDNISLTSENLTKYNDIAYYLEQSKAYEEAIFLLEKIIKEFPDRTVAYINLGDAYWGMGEKEEAKKVYHTYMEQMKANGKESKVPKTVLERLK
ncbi:tetratricopeptide repeat protein [Aquimarina sp. LLG6339-5]|uniref:tetratricopeptide repeat protein n=1 Tax=Aquimarina sp. LLG6339-5 TaxID=3160830 RepID=UPI00386C4E1C